MKVISERLGHATTSFTRDVYIHAIPALEEEAADRIGKLLLAPPAGPAGDEVEQTDEPIHPDDDTDGKA